MRSRSTRLSPDAYSQPTLASLVGFEAGIQNKNAQHEYLRATLAACVINTCYLIDDQLLMFV